jgi:hypothetical protein
LAEPEPQISGRQGGRSAPPTKKSLLFWAKADNQVNLGNNLLLQVNHSIHCRIPWTGPFNHWIVPATSFFFALKSRHISLGKELKSRIRFSGDPGFTVCGKFLCNRERG